MKALMSLSCMKQLVDLMMFYNKTCFIYVVNVGVTMLVIQMIDFMLFIEFLMDEWTLQIL